MGEFQGMQHQIAQSYTEITAARHLVYNAARKKEAGEDFLMDAAMAKLYASQVAGRVSGLAVEWMGGMGFVREGLAEKYWRDSKIGAIYEGTSNIQYVHRTSLTLIFLLFSFAVSISFPVPWVFMRSLLTDISRMNTIAKLLQKEYTD